MIVEELEEFDFDETQLPVVRLLPPTDYQYSDAAFSEESPDGSSLKPMRVWE